jgi:hypothetical protein
LIIRLDVLQPSPIIPRRSWFDTSTIDINDIHLMISIDDPA